MAAISVDLWHASVHNELQSIFLQKQGCKTEFIVVSDVRTQIHRLLIVREERFQAYNLLAVNQQVLFLTDMEFKCIYLLHILFSLIVINTVPKQHGDVLVSSPIDPLPLLILEPILHEVTDLVGLNPNIRNE